jgi:hypothetical protein
MKTFAAPRFVMARTSGMIAAVIVCVATYGTATTGGRAFAGPPSSSAAPVDIPRTPAWSKPKKPTPADRSKAAPIPTCLRARYAELEGKVPAIRGKHFGDPKGFEDEYAAEKERLVGQASLLAAGCGGSP